MEEKMVLCTRAGFASEEIREYVMDQLTNIAGKTHYDSLDDEILPVMMNAFESADVQAIIAEKKVCVNIPENCSKVFRVSPVGWKAEIPYTAVISAIDVELDKLRRRYGLEELT